MSQSNSTSDSRGINAQVLGTVIETIKQQPDRAKVTFQVQTSWIAAMDLESLQLERIFRLEGKQLSGKKPLLL